MEGTCQNCGKENQYLYRVPIATPKGEDKKIEMWCKECVNSEEPTNYDVS